MARVLLIILGTALILRGIGAAALGVFGKSTVGTITHVRRQGGERDDVQPGRYTYIVSYSFTLQNGKTVENSTTKIWSGGFVENPGITTIIRYWPSFPGVNALDQDTKPGLGQLLVIAAGLLLVFCSLKPTS